MLIICRVYEYRQEHRELPAVVKPCVGRILKDDGRYKNISCSYYRNQQGQQYQTHHQTSKPHITILVNIFYRSREKTFISISYRWPCSPLRDGLSFQSPSSLLRHPLDQWPPYLFSGIGRSSCCCIQCNLGSPFSSRPPSK